MAASISALLHQPANREAINSANPLRSEAAAAPANGSGAANSAGISANDFLTLLVTEMKNQDPTAQTDPNEYINQLVQVNSLEQLISINEKLPASSTQAPTGKAPGKDVSQPSGPPGAANHLSAGFAPNAQGVPSVSGNLTIPTGSAAAQRVAEALSGHLN